MSNFFEEAAFAMLDPTSLSAQQPSSSFSSSFYSFSSLSDIDVSSLGLELREPRERQIKSSRSVDASPSLCAQDNAGNIDDLPPAFYCTMTSRFQKDAGTSSPADSLSPALGGIGSNSPASAVHPFNLPPSILSAAPHPSSSGYQPFSYFDGALYNAPYSQPALSNKSSVESFASSTSDVLQTPRHSWCHPWDELSMPSGHQSIPGQSPAQPPFSHTPSRSRIGSPRRDRALSLKSSMPALVEEVAYQPSQGLGTLPEYQTTEHRGSADDVFFFVADASNQPSEEASQVPLLPPAALTGEHNRGCHVQAPTFPSQATFEQVANSYLVNGPDGRQQWTSQQPGHSVLVGTYDAAAYVHSDDPDGPRPLTAPESGSEEFTSAPPTAMRKSRSNDPRVRKTHPSSPADLFTFQEREIPLAGTGNPAFSKGGRQSRLSRQRSPGELFATQPIDEARAGLTIKVQPLTNSNGQPGYFQPHGHFHPGLVPPITPEEQTFPFYTPSNSMPTHPYAHTTNMEELSMPQGSFQTPPRTGRTHSSDSTGSSVFLSHTEPALQPTWKHPRTISMGTPSVMQCPPLQRSVSYGPSSTPGGTISGWSDTTNAPVASLMTSVVPTTIEQRPIAALPLPRKRTPSNSKPKPRKPSTKKSKAPPTATAFACSFINFTQDDAEKLLTGVAPSGSAKRRREVSGGADEEMAKRAKK